MKVTAVILFALAAPSLAEANDDGITHTMPYELVSKEEKKDL